MILSGCGASETAQSINTTANRTSMTNNTAASSKPNTSQNLTAADVAATADAYAQDELNNIANDIQSDQENYGQLTQQILKGLAGSDPQSVYGLAAKGAQETTAELDTYETMKKDIDHIAGLSNDKKNQLKQLCTEQEEILNIWNEGFNKVQDYLDASQDSDLNTAKKDFSTASAKMAALYNTAKKMGAETPK